MKQLFLLLLLSFIPLLANAGDSLEVSTIPGNSSYSVGDTATVALVIAIPKEHHLYANPLGPGIGKPTTVTPQRTAGITWIGARQQQPEKYEPEGMEEMWVWAWHNETVIFVQGIVTENAPAAITASFEIDGLICKSACIPVHTIAGGTIAIAGSDTATPFSDEKHLRKEFERAIVMPLEGVSTSETTEIAATATEETDIPQWDYIAQESERSLNLGLALFFAFIAGIILNFMPCVLPVLGIKILSFSQGRENNKATAIVHSIAFAAGMLLVFMVLASFAAFAGLSWGEQFQNPVFIVVLISLMFLFALGMFDLFIILVPNKVAELDMKQESSHIWGNVAKGMFATILATPCSGPFLGATLAWTVTQPKLVVYLVFLSLGLGMASPYVLLAASTRLSRLIPKPGAWMEDFKHILGFFLFGFGIYLMIGLPRDMVLPTVSLLLFIAAAVLLYVRIAPFGSSVRKKIVAILFAAGVLYSGYFISFEKLYPQISEENAVQVEQNSAVQWVPFSVQTLEEAHAEGRPVLIDFTANWCMNCQFNKLNVYHTKEVEDMLLAKSVVAIKADLTTNDPVVESLRNHLGSRSIPFLAIFDPEDVEHPIVMRDLVSKKEVLKVLETFTVQ